MAGKKIGLVLALDGEQKYTQAIQNAKKETSLYKTELKNLTQEFEGNANSMEALKAKQEALTKQQDAYQRKLDAAKAGLDNAKKIYNQQSDALSDLKKRLEEAQKAQQKMEDAGDTTSEAYKEQCKQVDELSDAVDKQGTNALKASGRVTDWNKRVLESEGELKKANKALDQNEQYLKEAESATDHCATSIDNMGNEVKDAEKQLKSLGDTAKDASGDMGDAGQAVSEFADTLEDTGSKSDVFMGVLQGGLVGTAITKGLEIAGKGIGAVKDSMYDISGASAELAAKTGATTKQMESYKSVMLAIRGNNFGEDYRDVSDAMAIVTQTMGELNDTELQNVTESAITLRDTFGMDYQESLRAVKMLTDQFGVSSDQAFNLIVQGAQQGLNKNGDLLDSINEYSVHYSQMGLSADEFFNSLKNGTDAGTFSVDKLGDAYKEFGIRVKDTATSTDEAYSLLGLNADEMRSQFAKGGESAKAATDTVLDALFDMDDQVAQNQAGVDLFGTMWEDLGASGIQALTNVEGGISSMGDAMEDLKKNKYSDFESAVSGLGAAVQKNIVAPIADAALPVITDLFQKVTDTVNKIETEKTELETFIEDIQTSNEEVQNSLDSARSTLDNAIADTSTLEAYKQTLMELNEQESLTEFQKYQIANAVQTLGNSVPGLTEAFDAETGTLTATNEQLKEMFDNAEAIAMQNAIVKAQADSYEALAQAAINKAKADNAAEIALSELTEKQEELYKAQESGLTSTSDLESEIAGMAETLGNAESAQKEANEQYEAAEKQIQEEKTALAGLSEQYGLINESSDDLVDGTKDVGEATTQTAEEIQAAADSIAQSTTASSETQQAALQAVREKYEEFRSQLESDIQNKISLFDTFDGGEDVSVEEMLSNLETQREGLENWKSNMETLAQEVGTTIAPEFYNAILEMGPEAANAVDNMVKTLEQSNGKELLHEMSEEWGASMDFSESTSKAFAATQTAIAAGLRQIGSTDADFSDLTKSINLAVSNASGEWGGLADATETALENTISLAHTLGIQIPEGLVDGIASGETSPAEALEALKGAIQGQFDGLAEVASQQGIEIPSEIKAGIEAGGQEAVAAYTNLITLLSGMKGEAQTVGQETGGEISEGTASSIASGQGAVDSAAGSMVDSANKTASSKTSGFLSTGQSSASQYVSGLQSGIGMAVSAGGSLGSAAYRGAASYSGSFYSVGINMAAGLASGINSGSSSAISAAASMASNALAAAKARLEIHSPSKKFEKDVGKQISAGTAFGISRNASLASSAADKMSKKVYDKATAWLTKYKKSHKVSLADEQWYWKQVAAHAKKGTAAYNNAVKKASISGLRNQGLSYDLAKSIVNKFGVSQYTTQGTGKNKKTVKKDAETYYGDILSAAQTYFENYKTLHTVSTQKELVYWQGVQKRLKKGTQAWYDAQKQINSAKEDIAQEKADKRAQTARNQQTLLDNYKTYYKMSEKAEMQYWDKARKQFKAGTQERIDADEKYLDAKQAYYDKLEELDSDYKEKQQEINDDLEASVKELTDAYDDAVRSRKNEIMSSMGLFDAFDASGYDGDTLLYNLQTQVQGLALWEQQLEELSQKGVTGPLLEELQSLGPDAAANIWSLNHMTEEQLDQYVKLWNQKAALADSQAIKENEPLRTETNEKISQLKKDAQKELDELNKTYQDAIKETTAGITKELSGLITKAGKVGEDAIAGLVSGIKAKSNSVDTYKHTNAAVKTVSDSLGVLIEEGNLIGKSTLDGMLEGLQDEDKIKKASINVVNSIKQAMEQEAEIHSPSRLFKRAIGLQMGAGVGTGLEESTDMLQNTSRDVIRDALAAAQKELANQQASLDADMAALDTSGITALNNALTAYQPATPIVNVDNSGVVGMMQQFMSGMRTMVDAISNMGIYINEDTLVGQIQPALSQENATATIRRNRGNI